MELQIVERSYKFYSVSVVSRSEAEARVAAKAIADTLEVVKQCGLDIHARTQLEVSSKRDIEKDDYIFVTHIRFTVVPSNNEVGTTVRHSGLERCFELEEAGWGV